MLRKPDEDGRYPLSGREWNALRCVQTAMNELDVCQDYLKERLKLTRNGWRFLRAALAMMDRVCDLIYSTVPRKKLMAMREEVRHSQIRLIVKGADDRMPPGIVYVDEDAFIAVMDYVISQECWCCEKTGKDVKRCRIKQLILGVLHYESDPAEFPEDGHCELAGHTSSRRDE